MEFSKWQGTGNDFVLIGKPPQRVVPIESLPEVVPRICDRHFGVGADGVIFIWPEPDRLVMRIFNSDGSEAEMCGNGLRCAARYAYQQKMVTTTSFPVLTGAGVLVPELIDDGANGSVRIDMGEPVLEREKIPVAGGKGGRVLDEMLTAGEQRLTFTAVSMGNPHCLLFVSDTATAPVLTLGPVLERHPIFPRHTNVEFVSIKGENEVDLRVWERGVGETLACGTGACATVVGGALTGRCGRKVRVNLPGGTLLVEWQDNNHVYLNGPAVEVFRGDWPAI